MFTKCLNRETLDLLLDRWGVQSLEGQDEQSYGVDANDSRQSNHDCLDVNAIEHQVRLKVKEGYGGQCQYIGWHRADCGARNVKGSLKNGPAWDSVKFRGTYQLCSPHKLVVDNVQNMGRRLQHRPLPWDTLGACTILLAEGLSMGFSSGHRST